MRRDLLLLGEMIEAATQAVSLTKDTDLETLEGARQRREALLWNFTVLGEAAAQLDEAIKTRSPTCRGLSRRASATGASTATGRSTSRSCTPPRPTFSPGSSNS